MDWTGLSAIATALAALANFVLAFLTWRSVRASETQAKYAQDQTKLALDQADRLRLDLNLASKPRIYGYVEWGDEHKLNLHIINISRYPLLVSGQDVSCKESPDNLKGIPRYFADEIFYRHRPFQICLPDKDNLIGVIEIQPDPAVYAGNSGDLVYSLIIEYLSPERPIYVWDFQVVIGFGPVPFISPNEPRSIDLPPQP